MAAKGVSDNPPRGRGGFRDTDLVTKPPNTDRVRAFELTDCRPSYVMANYVPINVTAQTAMHRYRVDFVPDIESETQRREVFRSATRALFNKMPAFDGVHECRSRQKLDNDETNTEAASSFGGETKTFKLTLSYTGTASSGPEMVRSYNMEIKHLFRLLGFFQPQPGLQVHPDNSQQVGSELRMLRGFRTSANIHEDDKLMMNFEGAHKLMQMRNVRDLMDETRRRASQQQLNIQQAISSELVGKVVITSYRKRVYRIESVDFGSNPTSTFSEGDRQTSYIDYLRNKYNVNTQDATQPLLTVIPNNVRRRGEDAAGIELKLVPEHCNLAGLTETQRENRNVKMDLIRASQISPQGRVEQLQTFLRLFHSNQEVQNRLREYGYSYDKEPLKITGHTWPMTKITCHPRQREPMEADKNKASININSLAKTPMIDKMAIIIGRNDSQRRGYIESGLRSGFEKLGMRTLPDGIFRHDLDGDSPMHYSRKIKSLEPGMKFAIVVIEKQNKNVYDAIKKAASSEMGLITQVVTSRLLSDQAKLASVSLKIAIQIAAKIGGEPWWADIPLKRTMVCGYDTYHDTTNRGKSFGAFLASTNDHYSRWFSKADKHESLQEISSQISYNMLEAINYYKEVNKQLPERIIIYRDGVGEGQIKEVFENELKSIVEKVKSVEKRIKLSMILVNKRIGARFYAKVPNRQEFTNPLPGTVIDHTVTRSGRFDFYLISQSTSKGTITPTYYNIIHDENAFIPEIHQKLAFKLCLLYYNWSGTVRVPAPCQYAHKLAYLCGEHLHDSPNANLRDRLHFL